MPASLKQVLADPFAFGDHPDVQWRVPEKLPPTQDLALGINILEAQLQRVDRKHAAFCLSKILVGFNERKTGDEAKLLLEVWLEANGDLPNDLWSAGVLELLQTHKFGMPKPVHLREAVAARLTERTTKLTRARAMLAKAGQAEKPQEFVKDRQDVRDRTLRDSLLRIGKTDRAAAYERSIAVREGREPEDWARAAVVHRPSAPVEQPVYRAIAPRPDSAAALKRSLARQHRAQGRTAYAEQLERDADALSPQGPTDEPPHHVAAIGTDGFDAIPE
ncbi:hypothetical protein UFOVP860_24 [uncultured Caudovirales phage]|uniref:Uncharacterized protein n=1 Tax=uncultured Caudovirales phage TaxID=2100421 RepID=A0A6J5RVC9_9CAUD|nr:hypothetical protein UFOVP860_24 [uncultured Caudovirales phage]CAB4196225.1 hypothetical protein UFOVP1293_87 [uncultured Caudovirales phage]CAB4222308.1 hypothetical protein UFOVP1644_10 [uncultured Caudovirales phage]